ncbi:unnamed protein product [Paramecium pentaurelia]|uniref:H-type lectin domain-containing protein n=1 Tax=Paramecium pentaurelia TaxID=43138 RepID=A0A8S1WJP0_9CILI|nr:unnamed protein product [Paramecium pentaurelia]
MFQIFYYVFFGVANHRFEYGFVDHFSYKANTNLILYLSQTPFREEEYFIPFYQQFTQVPDVYLNIVKLDLEYTFPQGYSLDIISISTVGFKIKIVCESPERFYRVEFNWFAFDDERVQVINNFNITNPKSSYIHTYQKDCKINIVISNFVSYYALGSQFNNLTGLILTPETVTISFYIENLKQIGYQILLSRSDIFLIGPIITSIQPDGSSQVVNFPSEWGIQNCYLNLLGFKHDGSDLNIRLLALVTYSSQITVGFYPWGPTIILSIQYNHFCINDPYFELAIFKGLMQSRFFDPLDQITTHIEIQEINYSQNNFFEEQVKIAKEIESIKIIFYWKCLDKEVLKVTIFCTDEWCTQTTIKCDIKKINIVRLQAKFSLNQISEQYINIAKTSVSLSASQVFQDKNLFEQVLFKIEIQ